MPSKKAWSIAARTEHRSLGLNWSIAWSRLMASGGEPGASSSKGCEGSRQSFVAVSSHQQPFVAIVQWQAGASA